MKFNRQNAGVGLCGVRYFVYHDSNIEWYNFDKEILNLARTVWIEFGALDGRIIGDL